MHARNQGVGRMQDGQKDGVEHAHQPHDHPDGDAHGQPNQQAGDEILFEAAVFHGVGQSVRSAFRKINGRHMKPRSLRRWPLLQALRCRWLGRLKVWSQHRLRCPLQQALRQPHHP
jgi:hypothetical protein